MSYASEVRGFRDWLPNSFRFRTQAEAEAFIAQVKAQWVPADFVRATRTLEVNDPINAKWDPKKKDAVKIDVKDLAAASKEDEDEASNYVEPAPLPAPPTLQQFIDVHGRGPDWPFASPEALKHFEAATEAWRATVRSGDRWYDRQDSLPVRDPPKEERRRLTPADHANKPEVEPLPPIGRGICDDCARKPKGKKPKTGPQEYATCRVCGILRACFEVVIPDEEEDEHTHLIRRGGLIYGDRPTDWQDSEDMILKSLRCATTYAMFLHTANANTKSPGGLSRDTRPLTTASCPAIVVIQSANRSPRRIKRK